MSWFTSIAVAATPVNAEPSNAGSVPVNCAAGRLVKLAPEPENKFAVEVPATVDVPDTLTYFLFLPLPSYVLTS